MKNLMKYASLLMAAVMLFSCQGTIDPEQGGVNPDDPTVKPTPDNPKPEDLTLKISSDRNLVQTNVDVATITVTLGEEVITEDVVIYDQDFNVVDVPDFKFTAKKAGDHVLWASYGTYNSEEITIKAIDIPIPETPADPKPESTSFKARVLMTEFTTTGCTWCPNMKLLLHKVMEDSDVADKVVFTACHSGMLGRPDPAYIKTTLDEFCNFGGFPNVNFDFYYTEGNYNLPASEFKAYINDFHSAKEEIAAGIAVNSQLLENNQLIVKATVKAPEEGEYRLGAFLLEDGIYGEQAGGLAEPWMNTHDNVVRYIDSKYYNKAGKEQYFGYTVGKVEKGDTADYVFDWDLDVIWSEGTLNGELNGGCPWDEFVMENLHLVVFVSTVGTDSKGNQYYYVNNVIDCPINGMTPYEYR